MAFSIRTSRRAAVALGALFWITTILGPVEAAVAYCSSQNTGSSFQPLSWDWQSNGWCTNTCNAAGTYAYAIILSKSCWCSNYTPQNQQDLSKCASPCPGFPTDSCGNSDESLYIYLNLGNAPSSPPASSKAISIKPSSAMPSFSPFVQASSTGQGAVTQTTPLPTQNSQSSAPVSTFAPAAVTTTATFNSIEVQLSVRIITQSGQVVTQTVTPSLIATASASASSSASALAGGSRQTNVAPIVGGVLGGVAGIALIIGGTLFILRRRNRTSEEERGREQNGIQRKMSTMSRSGLLPNEKGARNPPPILVSPDSRDGEGEPTSPMSGFDRRSSRHIIDQRLNPQVLFTFQNTSRGSIATLEDSRDYHRPLNVRNPDID